MSGVAAIKYILGRMSVECSDEQAQALWNETKAVLSTRDFPEVIKEAERSASGNLDTMEREVVQEALGFAVTSRDWPCNGDSQAVSKEFFTLFCKGLIARGMTFKDNQ